MKVVHRLFFSLKARNFLIIIVCYTEETENMLHAVLQLFCHIFLISRIVLVMGWDSVVEFDIQRNVHRDVFI